MTATSLVPEQGEACGISFPDLCKWMVEDASCDR
jgi:D-alanine-D-alanine ligase